MVVFFQWHVFLEFILFDKLAGSNIVERVEEYKDLRYSTGVKAIVS